MMPEALDSVATAAATIVTASGVFAYYWRKGDKEKMTQLQADVAELRKDLNEQNVRHENEVKSMNERATLRDGIIARLEEQLIQARMYIAMLRGILADRGIPTPEPDGAAHLLKKVEA